MIKHGTALGEEMIFGKQAKSKTLTILNQATNLTVVGSSPTVVKNFSFCILSLSTRIWQVNWSYTNKIKHDIHLR